jgi:hypothetical protein
MIETNTKKWMYLLLLSLGALVVADVVLGILWGYTSGSGFVFLFMFSTPALRLTLVLVCIGLSAWLLFKNKQQLSFTVLWLLLAVVGFFAHRVPLGHYETVGGLLSLIGADPYQASLDARHLADEYPVMTCFGFPQRHPCDDPVSPDQIPESIQQIHASQSLLILTDYVLIEKFGLLGVFRGYIAFREGSDPWQNEKRISRLPGCDDCWKIRIVDGFYWYVDSDADERAIFFDGIK